jgi:hypothetical protein
MKRELKEENILNYLDYLVQIKIAYGSDRCAEHLDYALKGARENYSAADVKRLRAELLRRIPKEYERRIADGVWKPHDPTK